MAIKSSGQSSAGRADRVGESVEPSTGGGPAQHQELLRKRGISEGEQKGGPDQFKEYLRRNGKRELPAAGRQGCRQPAGTG